MKGNSKITAYFTFTPKEKKGTAVLLITLLVVVGVKFYIDSKGWKNVDVSDVQIEIIEGERSRAAEGEKAEVDEEPAIDKIVVLPTKPFNPNTASEKELQGYGFSLFSARNVVRYRDKGGVFSSPEDLIKIYGVEEPFIEQITHLMQFVSVDTISRSVYLPTRIELNTADTNMLEKLPCVGPVLSKRIIKYRNLLGGYHNISQLNEVYGIDSSCYNTLQFHLVLDKSYMSIMNVNLVEENVLRSHPYIEKYQARAIVKYRELVGDFTDINQLLTNNIVSETDFERISPYLIVRDND